LLATCTNNELDPCYIRDDSNVEHSIDIAII
jgi:hypothetical protein